MFETNKILKDFSHSLELHPNYFGTHTRQDTIVLTSGSIQSTALDFTKASSFRYEYQNAFNLFPEPGTSVRWR